MPETNADNIAYFCSSTTSNFMGEEYGKFGRDLSKIVQDSKMSLAWNIHLYSQVLASVEFRESINKF